MTYFRMLFFSLVLGLTFSANAYEPPVPKPIGQWLPASDNFGFALNPKDPISPRAVSASTGPNFNVYDYKAAFRDVAKDAKVKITSKIYCKTIEAWMRAYAKNLQACLADIDMNGTDSVMFATVMQNKGAEEFFVYAMWMPKQTYTAWGGITYNMMDNGLIKNQSIFKKVRRNQIAQASYNKQLALFIRIESLRAEMNQMMAQQMMIDQMTNLNLDLMFGDLSVKP